MDALDLDRLKGLIETLQFAHDMGFSSKSSPIEFLLDAAIDLCLTLSDFLKEGTCGQVNNPEIKFLDFEKPDALGNSKQVSFRKERALYWDPKAAIFVRQLASFFANVKKHRDFSTAFAAFENTVRWSIHFSEKLSSENCNKTKQKELVSPQKAKSKSLKKSREQSFYRRQRSKRLKSR